MIAKDNLKPALIIGLAWLVQWALLFWDVNPTWDAAFYYAYAHSIVFDHDLRIENNLQLSYSTASPDFANKRLDEVRTETGRVVTPFPIGSALIWLPWLAILRLIAGTGQQIGLFSAQFTGYEWFFTMSVAALSALLGWLAFWLGYLISREEVGRFSSLAATVTLLFTTPLVYYQSREPLYAHATAAFTIALVVFVWWRSYQQPPVYRQGVLLGGLIGLAALVRSQHLVFWILPVISVIWWWFTLPDDERRAGWLRPIIYLGLVGLASLAVFSIQMVHWYLLFNSWITVPYGPLYMDWLHPQWGPLLFSTFRGVLTWMPVAFLSLLGLLILGRRKPRLVIPLLSVLLLMTYVNSAVRDWFGGGGYGPRRYAGVLVIFILGYAALLRAIPDRLRKPLAISGGILLWFHQWLLLRYGFPEGIGGRVLSMYPAFSWTDESYLTFGRQLFSYLPAAFRSPLDFLVLNLSPVDQILNQSWPAPQLVALISAAAFLVLAILLVRLVNRRAARSLSWQAILVTIGILAILAADLWILFWA